MVRNTQEAEDTLKGYETRLRDVSKVPAEEKEVEEHRNLLKVRLPGWRSGSTTCPVAVVIQFCSNYSKK